MTESVIPTPLFLKVPVNLIPTQVYHTDESSPKAVQGRQIRRAGIVPQCDDGQAVHVCI